jgi:hypothetical protein
MFSPEYVESMSNTVFGQCTKVTRGLLLLWPGYGFIPANWIVTLAVDSFRDRRKFPAQFGVGYEFDCLFVYRTATSRRRSIGFKKVRNAFVGIENILDLREGMALVFIDF